MKRITCGLLLVLLIACRQAPDAPPPEKQPASDPAIKYYKGPADGRKAEIHLQSGFNGEHITLHYNDVRLYDGDPKTKNTLGLAKIVPFTIGDEKTGKIGIQVEGKLLTETFTWENGLHIGISIGFDEKRKLRWEQRKKAFEYD